MNLLKTTTDLLANRPRTLTLEAIADRTGLKLGWLKKFSQGKAGDPAVGKVQALYDFLTNNSARF